jgi:hypothetical protein
MKKEISAEKEFEEVNNTIRHYSNLRFIALPIYFSIFGTQLIIIKELNTICIENLYMFCAIFSTLLFLFFSVFEYRLHVYLERFVGRARVLSPDCFWASRPRYRLVNTLLLIALYAFVVIVWWLVAMRNVPYGCGILH